MGCSLVRAYKHKHTHTDFVRKLSAEKKTPKHRATFVYDRNDTDKWLLATGACCVGLCSGLTCCALSLKTDFTHTSTRKCRYKRNILRIILYYCCGSCVCVCVFHWAFVNSTAEG